MLPVVGQGLSVPVVGDGTEVRGVNLDCAATTPALVAVAERIARVLPYYGSVHRGAGLPARVSTALYEHARTAIGRFAGARPDDEVVITRNTTDALNLLAGCVPDDAGDVLVLDVEHHANLLPWRRRPHRQVPIRETVDATVAALEAALVARPAALLTVTGATNVTGEVLPLEEITELARAHGARVAIDAAQLAPHRRFSLAALGADYVAFSGHKLYAPYGAGALVGRRDWLDAGEPYLAGGGAVREVLPDAVAWAEGPARHEGGTPNLLGAVALAEACATLDGLPAGALERHEAALRTRLLDGLAEIEGIEVVCLWPDTLEAIGVVAFTVAHFPPGLVSAVLAAEHGVGVRDGRFCAHQLLARLGLPDGAVRASFGVASTSDDIDRLVTALDALVQRGPSHTYAREDGTWTPAPDDRRLPAWLGDAAMSPSPCALPA
ncbi:MAG: aminotransferase class V-fold PLP-dependent enzyme [Solirubrobacterales bacterium]|nr:aminotransferase class V-fold PLP-dependent enzyme [Solirubrobacterales bacterium]